MMDSLTARDITRDRTALYAKPNLTPDEYGIIQRRYDEIARDSYFLPESRQQSGFVLGWLLTKCENLTAKASYTNSN